MRPRFMFLTPYLLLNWFMAIWMPARQKVLTASPATCNASAEIIHALWISSNSLAVFSTIMLNPPML